MFLPHFLPPGFTDRQVPAVQKDFSLHVPEDGNLFLLRSSLMGGTNFFPKQQRGAEGWSPPSQVSHFQWLPGPGARAPTLYSNPPDSCRVCLRWKGGAGKMKPAGQRQLMPEATREATPQPGGKPSSRPRPQPPSLQGEQSYRARCYFQKNCCVRLGLRMVHLSNLSST